MSKHKDTLLKAILAGICIGISGTVYLTVSSKYFGSFLFSLGLYVILAFGFNLFTSKVAYAVKEPPAYILTLAIIWLGNFIGTGFVGLAIRLTRNTVAVEKATELCEIKLADSPLSILILAFFCGMLMFIGADGYNRLESGFQKTSIAILAVMVFICAGFEHVIANLFYFTLSATWSWKTIGYVLVMTAGNALGGMCIPFLGKFIKSK